MKQLVLTLDLDALYPSGAPDVPMLDLLSAALRTKLGCRPASEEVTDAGFLATQQDGKVVAPVGSWRFVDTEVDATRGMLTSARDAILNVCTAVVQNDQVRRAAVLVAGDAFIMNLADAHGALETILGFEEAKGARARFTCTCSIVVGAHDEAETLEPCALHHDWARKYGPNVEMGKREPTDGPVMVKVHYFKPTTGKWYTEENVAWKPDNSHFTGWQSFNELHRLKGMTAVCLDTPLGYPVSLPGDMTCWKNPGDEGMGEHVERGKGG